MARTSPAATPQSQSVPATGGESPCPLKSNATNRMERLSGRGAAAAVATSSSHTGRKISLQNPLACAKRTTHSADGPLADDTAVAAAPRGAIVLEMYDRPRRAVMADETVRGGAD